MRQALHAKYVEARTKTAVLGLSFNYGWREKNAMESEVRGTTLFCRGCGPASAICQVWYCALKPHAYLRLLG